MTNNERLQQVKHLLMDIENNWNEEDIIEYPNSFPSFDELVFQFMGIKMKENFNLSCQPEKGK